jgi:hypothetical protein
MGQLGEAAQEALGLRALAHPWGADEDDASGFPDAHVLSRVVEKTVAKTAGRNAIQNERERRERKRERRPIKRNENGENGNNRRTGRK